MTDPAGELVVSYGGGVNTIALLILLARAGRIPRAIVMSDPGSERRTTMHYRDMVMPAWLERQGFPHVTVIDRKSEGHYRPRAWRLETLYEECTRLRSLPSAAYGMSKCSQKYKGDAQRWWTARQEWAKAVWSRGERLVRAIGYDADERRRVRTVFSDPWEAKRFIPWYPVIDAGLDRDGCVALIRDEGLPLPTKSACTFCPNNTLSEWEEIRRDEPDRFAEAIALSRSAELTSPDVVGLMRRNKAGLRQLHVWAEGGYPDLLPDEWDDEDSREAMPCECAL